jgi:ABC-type antimicrobial peptide transport system permease subunit
MTYQVTKRTREMGIRIALGAEGQRIFKMVMGKVLTLVVAGIAIGLAGAAATARILGSLLFGIGPLNPISLVGVCLFLLLVAVAAAFAPALRAVRTNPTEAIRTA